jgi:hypothetical protein
MEAQDEEFLVVDFTVSASEGFDSPADRLVQEINAAIFLEDPEGGDDRTGIGHLKAHLFNIFALQQAGTYLFDVYDEREQHLADAFHLLFSERRGEFKERVVNQVGFDEPMAIEWHLHATMLYLKPEHRGRRRGVRALRLLRQYVQRSSLIVTARAFPEEPDNIGKRPAPRRIASLKRYYLGDPTLGFRPVGPGEGMAHRGLVGAFADQCAATSARRRCIAHLALPDGNLLPRQPQQSFPFASQMAFLGSIG